MGSTPDRLLLIDAGLLKGDADGTNDLLGKGTIQAPHQAVAEQFKRGNGGDRRLASGGRNILIETDGLLMPLFEGKKEARVQSDHGGYPFIR